MIRKTTLTIITASLIILFSYTAISKLVAFRIFNSQLAMQPLPAWSIWPLTLLIPISELAVTALLLIKSTRVWGLYMSATLMAGFTTYMGLVIADFFGKTPCSCGGVLQQMGFEAHLAFNLFFLTISLIGIYIVHQMKGGLLSKL
jgi:putative oxidoreductase